MCSVDTFMHSLIQGKAESQKSHLMFNGIAGSNFEGLDFECNVDLGNLLGEA